MASSSTTKVYRTSPPDTTHYTPLFRPDIKDVYSVKEILNQSLRLPVELVNEIMDFAEYWASSQVWKDQEALGKNSLLRGRINENELLIRSLPIGVPNVYNETWLDMDTGRPTKTQERSSVPDYREQLLQKRSSSYTYPVRKIVFRMSGRDQGWSSHRSETQQYSMWSWYEAGVEVFDEDRRQKYITYNSKKEKEEVEGSVNDLSYIQTVFQTIQNVFQRDLVKLPPSDPALELTEEERMRLEASLAWQLELQKKFPPLSLTTLYPRAKEKLDVDMPKDKAGRAKPKKEIMVRFDLEPSSRFTVRHHVGNTRETQHMEVVWGWRDDVNFHGRRGSSYRPPAVKKGKEEEREEEEEKSVSQLERERLKKEGRGADSGDGQFVQELKIGDVVTLWGKVRFPAWVNRTEYVEMTIFWAV